MTSSGMTPEGVLGSTAMRAGHFLLESGHHSDYWLDLDLLFLRPWEVAAVVERLADGLRELEVEAVCGPLNEGAFVALMVASRLKVEFAYAERFEASEDTGLFPVRYRLPGALRHTVRGKRVAIVNDVISAGSAVRGAHADLLACGAVPVAVAALLALGDSAEHFAAENGLRLISLARRPFEIWAPAECPLCLAGVQLT